MKYAVCTLLTLIVVILIVAGGFLWTPFTENIKAAKDLSNAQSELRAATEYTAACKKAAEVYDKKRGVLHLRNAESQHHWDEYSRALALATQASESLVEANAKKEAKSAKLRERWNVLCFFSSSSGE